MRRTTSWKRGCARTSSHHGKTFSQARLGARRWYVGLGDERMFDALEEAYLSILAVGVTYLRLESSSNSSRMRSASFLLPRMNIFPVLVRSALGRSIIVELISLFSS